MNIYRISQTVNGGYDTYDSAVVVASSEKEATLTHPSEYKKDWKGEDDGCSVWCASENVKVELIGVVLFDDIEAGVVCASYNAG